MFEKRAQSPLSENKWLQNECAIQILTVIVDFLPCFQKKRRLVDGWMGRKKGEKGNCLASWLTPWPAKWLTILLHLGNPT